MTSRQLNFDDYVSSGAEARDAGMIEAEFAEVVSGSTYTDELYNAICAVARRQEEVHVDHVIPLVKTKPTHFNSAGAVWMRAIKEGVILKTGMTRPCMTDSGKHRHSSPVYRSGLVGRR